MFWISARVVPAIAFAVRLPERALTCSAPSACETSISGRSGIDMEPFGPFTVSVPFATSTVTSFVRVTGRFATLDIALNRLFGAVRHSTPRRSENRVGHLHEKCCQTPFSGSASRNDAQHLAAVPFGPRLAIRHHASRRRHDRNSETALHLRQLGGLPVDPKARAAHPLDLLDHRPILVILQANRQVGLPRLRLVDLEARDIALGLEDLGNGDLLGG